MPFGDFLKGKKSHSLAVFKTKPTLASASNTHQEDIRKHQPLENITEELFTSEDDAFGALLSFDPVERQGSLVKNFRGVLSNPNALGYFIQFMSSRGSESLVKFCLDVQSFQSCSKHVGMKCPVTVQGNPGEKTTCDFKEKNGIILKRSEQESDDEKCPTSPSAGSIDSGINESHSESLFSPVSLNDEGFLQGFSSEGNSATSEFVLEDNLETLSEENLINQTKDAMAIYQKYVAPESPMEIEFPLIVKHSIVTGICSESGQLDSSCFDSALDFVTDRVETEFFQDFLRSEYHAKHLVDILSQDGGRHVTIIDIIENEVLLFHFMEFLDKSESRNSGALLEFWISASNIRQQCTAIDEDVSFLRADVEAIYEKFISEKATSPLGFSESMRHRIENNISLSHDRIPPIVFDEALSLVLRVLHMRFVQKFINSQPFKNYISELTTAISTLTPNPKKDLSSSSSNVTLTSENSISISCQNTLLATASAKKRQQRPSEKADPNFLDLCTEADHLWRRKSNSITNIGHVDDLGRYTSDFEAPPDPDVIVGNQPMSKKLSQVMRRMITKSDVEKGKEELAWQMAAMIVKDVVSRAVHDSRNLYSTSYKNL